MQDLPSGNLEAFVQRLAAMRPKLHRYCARMTGSTVDGEDVVQEAMLKAIETFPRETDIANVDAWVFRIAHNSALDLLRRRARQDAWLGHAIDEDFADPNADAEHRLAAAASLRTFMGLPPAQRATVVLMDVLGYSLQEIGAVLDLSVASVKAALHRGRLRLRQLAADDRGASPPPTLGSAELRQLSAYIDRFNARDFDAVRALLAEDVKLDLVNRSQASGRHGVGRYFGNYAAAEGWRLGLGRLEGSLAVIAYDDRGTPIYFMLIAWRHAAVIGIRDFRYARYAMETAALIPLP